MSKPLFEVPIEEARRLRWEAGRRNYGGDAFVGDALEEAYDELIDLLNYFEESRRVAEEWKNTRLLERLAVMQPVTYVLAAQVQALLASPPWNDAEAASSEERPC